MSGRCAKRHVVCRIESQHPSGETEYVEATNWCANPQSACPRVEGEDYTKCRTICQQQGHAEINALALARKTGIDVRGGVVIVSGHYWICEACGRSLRDAGIREVRIEVA